MGRLRGRLPGGPADAAVVLGAVVSHLPRPDPQVEALASDLRGELHVIGVGSLDSAEAIAEFAGDVDGVTHLEDIEGELFSRFGITEQSSFVLLDADGQLAFETGYGGSEDLGPGSRTCWADLWPIR